MWRPGSDRPPPASCSKAELLMLRARKASLRSAPPAQPFVWQTKPLLTSHEGRNPLPEIFLPLWDGRGGGRGGGGRRPSATLGLRAERPPERDRTAPWRRRGGREERAAPHVAACPRRWGRRALPPRGPCRSPRGRGRSRQPVREALRSAAAPGGRTCACVCVRVHGVCVCAHRPRALAPQFARRRSPSPPPLSHHAPGSLRRARLPLQPLGWKICPATAGAGGAEHSCCRAGGEGKGGGGF